MKGTIPSPKSDWINSLPRNGRGIRGMGQSPTRNDGLQMWRSLRRGKYPTRATNELHVIDTCVRDNDERVFWKAENSVRCSEVVSSTVSLQRLRVLSWRNEGK